MRSKLSSRRLTRGALLCIALVLTPVAIGAADEEGNSSALAEPSNASPSPKGHGSQPGNTEASDSVDEEFLDGYDADLDDELLLFEDIPVVLSASRQPTPMNRTSVPISVMTADEIHASGKSKIEDLLRSIPGMDVLSIDRNRPSIGVRGLHDYYSDRTLVLIDGRSANNPVFGGIDLERLPINIEDIEKIEVVRGPGGAVWGANAFSGVINIILKDPARTQGSMSSVTLNEFGDVSVQARHGGSAGAWLWSSSLGFNDYESSSDALTGEDFESDDRSREGQFRFAATRDLSDHSDLEIGGGYSYQRRGAAEFLNLPMNIDSGHSNNVLVTSRAYARWNLEFDDDRDAFLQWSAQHLNDDLRSTSEYWVLENTIEGQVDASWGDGHRSSVGTVLRLVNADTEKSSPARFAIEGGAFREEWIGLFFVDRWRATNRTEIELQARGDYYSGTGFDSSGRATALVSLDREENSLARFSLAKSFRAPLSILRDGTVDRFPLPNPAPPGLFGLSVASDGDLENEQVYSVEAGITHRFSRRTELRIDTYWQRLNRIIASSLSPDPLSLGRIINVIENNGHARTYGLEFELNVTLDHTRVVAWYAYNELDTDKTTQTIRAYGPARHKAGLRTSTQLGEDWRLHGAYHYTSTTRDPGGLSFSVPEHHIVDLTLLWQWTDRIELTVGVSDLFDEISDFPVSSQATFTSHETPGRTVFLRAHVEF